MNIELYLDVTEEGGNARSTLSKRVSLPAVPRIGEHIYVDLYMGKNEVLKVTNVAYSEKSSIVMVNLSSVAIRDFKEGLPYFGQVGWQPAK